MSMIVITPYSKIEDQSYPTDTLITISANSFAGIQFQDGKITFSIIDCRFRKVVLENLEAIEFKEISIQFLGCYIEDIQVENIVSGNISVSFINSILSGRINSPNILSVSINNSIANSLFLLNQNAVDISFTEENIFPKRWRKLLRSINTDFSTVTKTKQSFYIYDTKRIIFRTSEKDSNKRGFYKRSYESLAEYKIGYYLTPEQKGNFNINLSIKYSREILEQETQISNSYLSSLSLSGNVDGSISVENTKINSWYISEFSSKGDVSFYNINPNNNKDSKIGIHKCNLDEVWFDNVDFDKYHMISLYRSKLSKTIFTSCSFPNKYSSFERFMPIENVHYPERKTQNHHKDQYEIFLQLKKSFENTGNYFESQKLQAIAHDALKKIISTPAGDKAILKINSWSNSHSQSIGRPFCWFILISVCAYIFYLLSLGRLFNGNAIDYKLIGYYFSFIDLTHRNDFLVDKDEFTAWSLTIDYLSKIVFGFLIYQFVAAFRKYGKK
jgi:hypothetical protein